MAGIIRRSNYRTWYLIYKEKNPLSNSFKLKVNREHYFKDKYLFYRFKIKEPRNSSEKKTWEDQLKDTILLLSQIAPDATLRMILRKP